MSRYVRDNIEDRISRDEIARQIWYDSLFWLKHNAWWSYRNVIRWIADYDDLQVKKSWDLPTDEFISWIRKGKPRRSYGGRGDSSNTPGFESEGFPGDYEKNGGKDMVVSEVRDFGMVEYGYGNWIRLVEKEGQYGKFLNLESGITLAGKDSEGNLATDTKTKNWFKLPRESTILQKVEEMIRSAAADLQSKEGFE